MKRIVILIFLSVFIIGCKTDKKQESNTVSGPIEVPEKKEDNKLKTESEMFESGLIDYRDILNQFNEDIEVESFGVQFANDSTMAFVFRLNESVNNNEIDKYSFAIKGFYNDNSDIFRASFNPSVKEIGNAKFIKLWHKRNNVKHFDSLQVYIYERNNWKNSGKLGGFTIRDVIME